MLSAFSWLKQHNEAASVRAPNVSCNNGHAASDSSQVKWNRVLTRQQIADGKVLPE
ncbi:hypothetical protein OAE40_01635 [Rubripirellula sp.]|nr:hypothetical protein [Rubripirellula sp.]MDB4654459.1 hypothetical protein [Rubripirellula sp.]